MPLNSKKLILKWIDQDLINLNNILQYFVRRQFLFFDEETSIIKFRQRLSIFHIHNTEDYKLVPLNIYVFWVFGIYILKKFFDRGNMNISPSPEAHVL